MLIVIKINELKCIDIKLNYLILNHHIKFGIFVLFNSFIVLKYFYTYYMSISRVVSLLTLLLLSDFYAYAYVPLDSIDEIWTKTHYNKQENMVSMRDGVRLYTSVYQPADTARHPILMFRSTYGSGPYGDVFNPSLWRDMSDYLSKGYIIVYQDVRGLKMSEGVFENVRPVKLSSGEAANDVTDMYDTAEWLVNNTNSNGNIGVAGCSYLGFTAFTAALCGHPAVKAVCPQAPVIDWFTGDDFHHNGAFMPAHAFGFLSGFGRPRLGVGDYDMSAPQYYKDDEYSFFLRNRAIKNLTGLLGDSIAFWPEMIAHPDFDQFWYERNPLNNMGNVIPAVLVVGGLFDAEDLYGAVTAYRRISTESPSTECYFVYGPWSHGGWGGDGNSLGALRFGSNTADIFRDIQAQFFDHYLLEQGDVPTDKVTVFSTGDNKWHRYDQWPPKNKTEIRLYLVDKQLISDKPSLEGLSIFHSDPDHPVPHVQFTEKSTGGEYMYADQRFASQRPDVLTFISEPVVNPITIVGNIIPQIWLASTTDDVDLVVKLIDVYPEDFTYEFGIHGNASHNVMGGYQQLVRGDIMPSRYRNGLSNPEPLIPGKPTLVGMEMPDVCHTFMPGHRIMIQIQASWFPLFRMSPQNMVDVYDCSDDDFLPADITIYHSADYPSHIKLSIIE